MKSKILLTAVTSCGLLHSAWAFEGHITAALTRGGQVTPLLYTAGTNFLRVEVTEPDRPNPVDQVDLKSGELTLIFPHNRSFVRLKNSGTGVPPVRFDPNQIPGGQQLTGGTSVPLPPAMPAPPAGFPPGVGPQTQPAALPAMPNRPGAGGMPAIPAMPMMPMPGEAIELKTTVEKTNLLGFACEKYEIKQRGEVMEIWATDELLPFQNYVRNQPPRFGPRMIEEQWAGLLTTKKLFPLLAVLRFAPPQIPGAASGPLPAPGPERFRFEVTSVTPQKLTDEEAQLFQPPTNYFEIEPLPF